TSVGRPRESSTLPHYSSGGVGLVSTGSTPPLFVLLVVLLDQPTKKQKTKFCVTADKTISFFPCLLWFC
ncbi:MAG: hypothetical protein IJV49_01175, partial [Aeriscardovia sp.]|nr:hypothetical protein [Aeriscardovia sp.]